MAKSVLDVTKAVNKFIFEQLDKTTFFGLNRPTDRLELFNFALSVGVNIVGEPTPLSTRESLVRTERLTDNEDLKSLYRSIYYDKYIKDSNGEIKIDAIVDDDTILKAIEEYANSGFIRIKNWLEENLDPETLRLRLMTEITKTVEKEFPPEQ